MLSRRAALAGGLSLAACAHAGPEAQAVDRLAALEARIGGRVGLCALNTETGAQIVHRGDERFAMCSTFKWLLAAQMLQLAERTPELLTQPVLFNESDLLSYAPVTRERIADGPLGRLGQMSVEELCEAAVVVSDNTAANLLLDIVGGPEGFTHFLRANGDAATRLDRNEPDLNENAPGDPRDTTTPAAMARTLNRFLLGAIEFNDPPLNSASREKLSGWMIACRTGRERLRAGLPADWRAGDKTGTGVRGAVNDVAIAWPPGRAPILIACYLSDSGHEDYSVLNAAHAEAARIVAETWCGR